MIIEDVAVVTVIVLFAWLVPARQNGIPGLGGRGRIPAHRTPAHRAPGRRPPGRVVRADPADSGGGQHGRDRERDERVLAELDKTWAPDYADRVAAQLRERKGRR
jgi:hypothetical protein